MERVAEQRKPDERRWGLIPSILVHILFFAALFLLPVVAMPIPQPEDSINVEMVPQPKEEAKNAAKPSERAGRVPTPTPRPDEKQPSKEPKAASTDKTEGEQTADKLSDESKTKAEKGPDPNSKDQDAKSQEPAQADKPADVKADQPAPTTEQADAQPQPGDAPSPTPADDQAKPQDQTPTTDDPAQAKQDQPPSSDPATQPQQQTADQSTPSADNPPQQTSAQQAAAEAHTQPQANPTPPASDDTAQQQQAKAEEAAKTDAEAKAAKPDAAASATDPNSSDPASTPTPEELATDQPSDTQIVEPNTPSMDAAGTQADQKDGAASDPIAGLAKTAEGQVDQQQAAADPKVVPDVAVPTTGGAQPQQQSQDQPVSGDPSDPTAGTTFVPAPQPRPQQQASADSTQDASKTDPSQAQQKSGGQQGKFIQAKRFYSGTEMARMSKDELDAWKKLPRRTRVQQLCNSEEKLQFGYELKASGFYNSLITPAMLSDIDLVGDGAGVLTPKGWVRVAFKCNVDDAALKVVAFSYSVRGHVSAKQLERIGAAGN